MKNNTNTAVSFKDLRVYKLAYESAMLVFNLSKKFPIEERYSLTDQMRRASRSVCANIAEAWIKRLYEKSFISKLSDSQAEAAEMTVWINFANDCRYCTAEEHDDLIDRYDHVSKQLTLMIKDSGRWTK